ncbi:MAG: histidinol phosphate phosphatase domain-containing protein [Armatimonadetes bacterium]|nr:histidinol phosphate phosphatase domain-containing protein [Armatimonadota bacterium]
MAQLEGPAQSIPAVCDFHTHTTLSDGVLSPIELVHRAIVAGYRALGIADHTGAGTLKRIVAEITEDCRFAWEYWGFVVVPAVELTHVPARSISSLAPRARELGAALVIVHGETIVEPVEPGTNLAAATCSDVDILAHPGLLDEASAEAAAERGVFLEISARPGHDLGNGLVAKRAAAAGAKLILGSDCHGPEQLLTPSFGLAVLMGAGLDEPQARAVLEANAQELLQRCRDRLDWLTA